MGRFAESRLRDMLAENLDTLEPGLRLHDIEHRLENAVGAGGRMDILARDRHGLYVVVEVKRSDSTAREALDEIAKYTELLRREQGIPPEKIRAIIASTTWHELLIPASNFASDWSLACGVTGFSSIRRHDSSTRSGCLSSPRSARSG
jgi:predicted RecB family nuclease